MDEQAIGGGAGEQMGKTSAESADNSGPLDKRILSKNWSVRAGAYEELKKMAEDANPGSKGDFMREHIGQFKVYLKDSNPGALEKCLDTLNAVLNKIHKSLLGPEDVNAIVSMLVEKCMGHMKPVIKAKSSESLLLLFEVYESFADSQDTLIALASHKNVKILAAGTIAIALLAENFGLKKIKFPDYNETITKNAQSTNPAVKAAAYEFYKGCYKWMGDAILPQIEAKLKKQQIDDLKKLFEEVKAKGDKSKRVFRSEKAAEEEAAKNAAIDAAMAEEAKGEEGKEEEVDPLEYAPEVDIIAKYGGEWIDATAAIKKWNEKVEAFDKFCDETSKCRVKPGNPEGLATFFKKEIGNSNINIATAAIKAGAALAKGMKKNFEAGIKMMVGSVLLKYKEKRAVVLQQVDAFLEIALLCTNLESIRDEVIPCISNVAPGVKTGTIKWVEKAVQVTYIDVLKNVSPELAPAMAKAIDDKDGTVREAALQCAGILKGRLGAPVMDQYLKNVNPQKMTKIDEAAKEVKPTKYDRPENWKPPAPKPAKKAAAADDELDQDVIKPKRAPPKGLGTKPKKKVEEPPAEDAPMADQEDVMAAPAKKPVAKPPPNIGKKPEPKKPAASSAKAPTAPVIQEEDLGAGLSKEQAIEKASEYFAAGTIAKFDSTKWQEKKEAFDELCAEITEKQPPPDVLEASAKFVKSKMKDWKESNINLQKGIVALYQCYATQDHVGKRTVSTVMSFFVDKLGDVKLVNLIKPALLDLAELVSPKFIANQIIKHAATAKAPKVHQESCAVLTTLCDEFGSSGLPLKETIDYGKLAAAQTTATVRQAANALFVELYKHVGDGIRAFMTDIKESTLKLIDAELDKATQYKKGEHEKKRQVRGAAAEEAAAAAPAGGKKGKAAAEEDPFAALPREDISKKLTPKLMEQFKHKDWKIRKKGGDDVEAIIREAKMRIENAGLNDLMDAMKNGMKDPNKAVVKVFIILLGLLAEALGPGIKQYTKKCYVPMLQNIMDKQALVRSEVINATNKWADAIGADAVINKMADQLIVENPESRTEIFRWILEHKDDIPNASVQDMVKPLVTCLTDKSKQIREDCQKVIMVVMPITGHQEFYDKLKDMKAAVQQTLRPILDKIKAEAGGSKEEAKEPEQAQRTEAKEKKPAGGSFGKAAEERKREKSPATAKGLVRKQTAAPAPPSRKAAPEEDEVTITPLNKEKRKISDGRNRYPLNEVKGDHVERLQAFCEQIFGQKFHDQMFAKTQDFDKHIKCVEKLGEFMQTQPDQLLEVLDVIFKWCNLRINDSSNTKLLMSVLDFYANLIQFFIENAYILEDFEAVVLIGTLCDKAGVNNKILLEKIRKLIRMVYEVYDVKLVYRIVLDAGVKSKNLKAVAENLDEVAEYFQKHGIDSCTKKDFALFLTCADNSDKGVRENALKVFGEAYTLLGEDVWRMFPKDIPIKVKGLLEARFKQVAKKSGGGALNRTGGNLNLSMNSAKAGGGIKGIASSDVKTKRMSVAPSMGVGGAPALGGLGLRFNKNAGKASEAAGLEPQEETDSSKVTKQMQEFELEERKEAVQDQLETNLQAVFQGKGLPQDDKGDVEMDNQEDDVAIDASRRGAKMSNTNPLKAPKDIPPPQAEQNVEMHNEDEMNRLLDMAEDNLDQDPEFTQARNFILNHINQLKIGDLLKRVDSLVALNEMISANGQQQELELTKEQLNQQKALVKCCNQLIEAFTHVMDDIFKYPVQDIPLRFTKYFITIVNKTCASKEIMKEVSQTQVNQLAEQLLTRLLIENLDKIGQNKEGELILKNLNSSMLRMLENCNHTYIFVVLFTLLKNKKDDMSMPKLAGLIIKCLLKLSKIMDKLIDKLDLSQFLIAIHEYLCCIDHENKSQNDDLGIRIVKTLVNEVVKLRREAIWQSYAVIENHGQADMHIKRWITIIIKSLPASQQQSNIGKSISDSQPSAMQEVAQQPAQSRMYIEFEIKKIVQDLKDPARMEQGIEKLNKFTKQNPTYDYQKHLLKESEQFAQTVNNNLNAHRSGKSWQSTTGGSEGQDPQTQNPQSAQISKMDQLKNKLNAVNQKKQDLNSSLNEQKQTLFESKMAKFQGRKSNVMASATNNLMSSREGGNRLGTVIQGGGTNNLNSSFSALNNSLSQKWAQINSGPKKIGGLTGRPGALQSTSALAQTANPGFSAQGTSTLNTSNNKFQRKATAGAAAGSIGGGIGGFAERVQKQHSTAALPQPHAGLAGQAKPNAPEIGAGGVGQASANRSLGTNGAGGGIASNSFRARQIQGFGNAGAQPGSSTTVPQNSGGASATNSDLQKRLADMKAKLQGLKKA